MSDLSAIHKLLSWPETDKYNALGIPANMDETKLLVARWMRNNDLKSTKNFTFAIENTQGHIFMGLFGLNLGNIKYKRGEVWFKIHPDFWNQGFATEVLERMLDFGFSTLQLHRIQAGCAVENKASIQVLEKVGMVREGRGRQVLPLKSGWSDNFEYAILESDDRNRSAT
ncbi:MAG: ribosomal-protein-alanine N-acetyltransferase [Luteibaculaceae bacterium]